MEKSDEKTMNILLVDDRDENILVMEELLELQSRNFLRASSGNEALKLALQNEIDLIILDVQMPGMDGFEIARILKSNKRTKDIPIIFATAEKKEDSFIVKGLEEGAIDYLYKPLNREITRAKVAVLLTLQRQKKELIEKNVSLEKSATLINNSADIIGVIEKPTLKFEEVNTAITTILGYSPEEIYGVFLTDFLSEEGRQTVTSHQGKSEERFTFECEVSDKRNLFKWLQWNIVNKGNKWFFNARDITEEKLTHEHVRQLNLHLQKNIIQLEAANSELESFSYSVSHDLRAPLRAVSGYTNMLDESYVGKDDDEARILFEKIQRNVKKMSQLIDDLLSFARLGRKEIPKVEVNMDQIVKRVVSDLLPAISPQTIFEIKYLHPVYGDEALLTQVWINFISNALKYSKMASSPTVAIGSYGKDDETIFFIKDNGVGFDEKYVEKLFGVFQRLHSEKEFEGTGIGLAIVKRIISKHGGRVWAEGEINKGATFYFSLPTLI